MVTGHRIGIPVQQKQRRLHLFCLCQGLLTRRMQREVHPRGDAVVHEMEVRKGRQMRDVPRHQLEAIAGILDKSRPAPHRQPRESELPPRWIVSEAQPWRCHNRTMARHRLLFQETQRDLPTKTVTEEENRLPLDRMHPMNLPQVVQKNAVCSQIATHARRTPVASQIPTHHVETTLHQSTRHMPIPPGMFAQPMRDNDRRPSPLRRCRRTHEKPRSCVTFKQPLPRLRPRRTEIMSR